MTDATLVPYDYPISRRALYMIHSAVGGLRWLHNMLRCATVESCGLCMFVRLRKWKYANKAPLTTSVMMLRMFPHLRCSRFFWPAACSNASGSLIVRYGEFWYQSLWFTLQLTTLLRRGESDYRRARWFDITIITAVGSIEALNTRLVDTNFPQALSICSWATG